MICTASAGAVPVWRATHQTVYEMSERDMTKLVRSYDAEFTYNSEGLPVEEVQTPVSGTKMRRETTYTASGRIATEKVYFLQNGQWQLYSEKLRDYDERTGAVILSDDFTYDSEGRHPGNCFRRNIKRNADGNITGVEISVYFEGAFDPTQRMTLTYGEDGEPTEITQMLLTSDGNGYTWVFGERYTDLVWESCNGQIYSVDDLYHGDNRLASGHYVIDNGSKPYDNYDITATYGDGTDLTTVFSGLYNGVENTLVAINMKETTTNDGGTRYETRTCYADADGAFPPENYLDINVFDAWDIETESSEYYWEYDEDERELVFMSISEVDYDETYGYPLEVTRKEDDLALMRIVYSGYVDCSESGALGQIEKEELKADNIYYDLSGRRVANPMRGIYIHNGRKICRQSE